jgi:hypothetical protein
MMAAAKKTSTGKKLQKPRKAKPLQVVRPLNRSFGP